MLTFDGTAGIALGATFECGEGWRGLISQAAAEVAELPEEWKALHRWWKAGGRRAGARHLV